MSILSEKDCPIIEWIIRLAEDPRRFSQALDIFIHWYTISTIIQ